ncbi:MAG: winged helix-turn-helix domain-containing protein [Terriglobia bacterium]
MSLKSKQLEFGPFRLDIANNLLLHDQKPIPLAPKAYDTLLFLLQNSNRLVTRDELMKAVWPDSFVEDGNLSVNIFQLRKALGETEGGRPYIETVPRKGYRFIAEVRTVDLDISGGSLSEPVILQPPEGMRRKPPAGEAPAVEPVFLTPERGKGGAGTAAHQPALSEIIAFPEHRRPEQASQPLASSGLPGTGPEKSHSRDAGYRWALVVGVCLAATGLLVGWFLWHSAQRAPQLVQHRLTSFAPEMAVTAAAISTGSKFIAYANPSGLFIQVIATGETHSLALPAPHFAVSRISWFTDSAELLIDGSSPVDAAPGMWIVPVIGTNRPVELGPYPPGALSPDGSKIAWVNRGGDAPEIQLMRSQGGEIHTVVTGSSGETFGGVSWYHGGRRLLFVRYRWNAQFRRNSGSIDFYRLASGKTGTVMTDNDLGGDAVSLPDGRIVYSKILSANPVAYGADLMEVKTDPQTGRASGASEVLAKWNAPVTDLSVNSGGTRLALRDLVAQHNIYMADLKGGGTSLANVRRFSFGVGREDFPRAWSPDSQVVFLDTNRNGNWQIYKRALDSESGAPFVDGPEDQFSPRVSPDGAWLLYIERPVDWHEPEPVNLMRVPISGGLPQPVLKASRFSEWGLRFDCPRQAGMPCVLAEQQGKQIVFRAFDPMKGFEPPASGIARFEADGMVDWAIKPDGSGLAWIERNVRNATIHLLALTRGRIGLAAGRQRDVTIQGWSRLHAISWAPGGNGWFLISSSEANWTLLRVDPQGKPHVLLKVPSNWPPDIYPSPDGRHLAFSEQSFGSNVWMIEHF